VDGKYLIILPTTKKIYLSKEFKRKFKGSSRNLGLGREGNKWEKSPYAL